MCVPMVGAVMLRVAVEEGEPLTTNAVPTVAPSMVTVTVPVGGVLTEPGGVIEMVSGRLLPAAGVVVAGVSVTVGVLVDKVIDAATEVELL